MFFVIKTPLNIEGGDTMTYREKILNMLSNEDIANMMHESLLPIDCDDCPLLKKHNQMKIENSNSILCKNVVMAYLDEEVSD